MSRPLRILYVITKSNWGGAQKYVFELACAAKAAGHDVSVACGGTGEAGAALGPLATKLTKKDIPVYPIPSLMRNMSISHDIKACITLWRLIRKQRPDVVHTTSSKAGGLGSFAGRLAGVPRVIFTSHGLTVDEVWRPRWQRFLIYMATWITVRLAHHSIMISTETFLRAQSMPFLSKRVSLIKNGIAPVDFLDKTTARGTLSTNTSPKLIWIGGIGELHPNKNWSAAIVALATLPQQTHLFIIGEGEERPRLQQLITQHSLQDRVHLLGYLDGARYLKAFDIFILPSKKEGLPYVLLEAGLAELAVVASDLPGNRDIIDTGHSGFLVEPSPEVLSTSLEILIRDDKMRRQFGSALSETVRTQFSIAHMFTQTLALYESINSLDR